MNDEMFVRVEASQLSCLDEFMMYEPKNEREMRFKEKLTIVIRKGILDFYRPKMDPSFDAAGNICFKYGEHPALGRTDNWWSEKARTFMPERGSRLGTQEEYVAFLGVLLKRLVESGMLVSTAWMYVCCNSEYIGNYFSFPRANVSLQSTGSKEVCGFCDLGNTIKLLENPKRQNRFCLAGGCFDAPGCIYPLAHCCEDDYENTELENGVGWIILEC